MNRRLLLKPMYPHAVSLGASGYVGYGGWDIAAARMWEQAGDWFDGPILPVNSGDRVTIKRPLPYRSPDLVEDDIPSAMQKQISDRSFLMAEMDHRTKVLRLQLEAARCSLPPIFISASQYYANPNKTLLLKRKKS